MKFPKFSRSNIALCSLFKEEIHSSVHLENLDIPRAQASVELSQHVLQHFYKLLKCKVTARPVPIHRTVKNQTPELEPNEAAVRNAMFPWGFSSPQPLVNVQKSL